MKRSAKDRARPGLLEAISGAERWGLVAFEGGGDYLHVWAAVHSALTCARDAVAEDKHPNQIPVAEQLRSCLRDCTAAFTKLGCLTKAGSPAEMVTSALAAAISFVESDLDYAAVRAAAVRKDARERDEAAAEQDRQDTLLAYQEAFWALRRGEVPVKLASGEDDRRVEVELVGASRMCGGVVIDNDMPTLATRWLERTRRHSDVYVQDLASKVKHACVEAVRATPARRAS